MNNKLWIVIVVITAIVLLAVGSAALSSLQQPAAVAGGLADDECTPPNGTNPNWEQVGFVHVDNQGFSLGDPQKWDVVQASLYGAAGVTKSATVYIAPNVRVDLSPDPTAAITNTGWKLVKWHVPDDHMKTCLPKLTNVKGVIVINAVNEGNKLADLGWKTAELPDKRGENDPYAKDPNCQASDGQKTEGKADYKDLGYIHATTKDGITIGSKDKWYWFNGFRDPDNSTSVLVAIAPGFKVNMPVDNVEQNLGWKGTGYLVDRMDMTEWYRQRCVTKIGSKLSYYPPVILIKSITDQANVMKYGWIVTENK